MKMKITYKMDAHGNGYHTYTTNDEKAFYKKMSAWIAHGWKISHAYSFCNGRILAEGIRDGKLIER